MPNIELTAPSCLHIPELQGGGIAAINWEAVAGYELDCRFEPTDLGESWSTVEDKDWAWTDVDDILSWTDIESAYEDSFVNIYRGPACASETE